MTSISPLVWHVALPSSGNQRTIERTARSHGWEFTSVDCVHLTSSQGRKAYILGRRDATKVYAEMHRRPVAVVYDGAVHVRTDPSKRFHHKWLISIHRFCRYKAFAKSLKSNNALQWDNDFIDWMSSASCDDTNDPRILPFHMFDFQQQLDLDTKDSRKRFKQIYRSGPSLRDGSSRRWSYANTGRRHGREPQTVRGLLLPTGFHWDVNAGKQCTIRASDSVWKVSPNGYINVYADGHVRVGDHCRQVWSVKQSTQEDAAERGH